MTTVEVSAQARRDLAEIDAHLEREAGPSTADLFQTRFEEAFRKLARVPHMGSQRAMLPSPLRGVSVNPYLIIYRFDPAADRVEVVRILHTSRDMRRLLPDT